MKQITWHDLQHIIKDDDVIGLPALAVANLPAEVLRAVLAQHDTYHTPNDLTFILANDIHSLGVAPDLDDFIERRMIKRVIMSILTASSKTAQAMKNNDIEAYFLPQGIIATHYRQSNQLLPGVITKIGLNTAVDPRYGGGKVNTRTTDDLVSLVTIDDETYLHYTFPSVDVALLRGTYADQQGNIYLTQESYLSECYHVALNIETEGQNQKFVSDVSHIDFNAQYSQSLEQEVYFVTDRAVFELTNQGLKLIEIAPGLDLHKDILNQMAFKPIIADHLKLIDTSIYKEKWGELKQSIHKV